MQYPSARAMHHSKIRSEIGNLQHDSEEEQKNQVGAGGINVVIEETVCNFLLKMCSTCAPLNLVPLKTSPSLPRSETKGDKLCERIQSVSTHSVDPIFDGTPPPTSLESMELLAVKLRELTVTG